LFMALLPSLVEVLCSKTARLRITHGTVEVVSDRWAGCPD